MQAAASPARAAFSYGNYIHMHVFSRLARAMAIFAILALTLLGAPANAVPKEHAPAPTPTAPIIDPSTRVGGDGTVTNRSEPRDLRWRPVIQCSGTPSVNDPCWGSVYVLASQAGGCGTPTACIYAGGKYWVRRPLPQAPPLTTGQLVCLLSIGTYIYGFPVNGTLRAVVILGIGGGALTIYGCTP